MPVFFVASLSGLPGWNFRLNFNFFDNNAFDYPSNYLKCFLFIKPVFFY